MKNKVTYRQQYTRCNKERCRKCKEGSGHGPYWYAYWSEKGRTVSKYIGKHLSKDPTALDGVEEGFAASIEQAETDTGVHNQSMLMLRIHLLGQFRIEHYKQGEWQAADNRTWHRRRTRALLGCLLSSPSRRLGREQVIQMLWPDLDIEIAANRLNGAVHDLRQILEPNIDRPSSSRLLRLERDMLELANNTLIWVDTEAFEQLLKEANMCTDMRRVEQLLEEAATLYQGNYLPEELYSEWAVPRRDALQRAWVDLQLRLTQIKVEQGAYVSAIEVLDRLRIADPTNETALQQLMLLLTHQGRRAEALKVYTQFTELLRQDYEGEPLPETTVLYGKLLHEKLLKEHIPPLFATNVGTRATPTQKNVPTSTPLNTVEAQPFEQEETDNPLSYTRPLFQARRQNQSSLIGREQELRRMRQLLLTIEQQEEQPINVKTEIPSSSLSSLSITVNSQPKQTHFLLLIGEPGIGKTRLVEELSLEAYSRDWTVAWSRSYEEEGSLPYHCWTQLLRTLLHSDSIFAELSSIAGTGKEQVSSLQTPIRGLPPAQANQNQSAQPLKLDQLSALLPELAMHIPPTQPSTDIPRKQERLYLWETILGLLTRLSKIHPLLLVFDDLHWADDSSLELLTDLTHHLQGQRILLIGTCRDGELPPQHKLRILTAELQRKQAIAMISAHPLTYEQIGTLVSYLPQQLIATIQTQAAGNPLFAEELARLVSTEEQGQLDTFFLSQDNISSFAGPASVLPDAITAVLERRLHRLSSGCRTLLGRAAVLGNAFELGQLQPMAPEHNEDAILDFLEEALHAGLLTEEGTGTRVKYRFWHPLITSYLYSHLSAARRAQLQRRAAMLVTPKNER